MSVNFIDFSEQYKAIKDEIDANLQAVFQRSNFILGQPVQDFEEAFAKYCDTTFGIGVNSGTDAIFIALKALGIKEGDEVIVPTFTFIATALGVSYTGAQPVFVDVQEDSANIDPEKIEAAITDKTKAIIAVHMYGQPADMDEISAIARRHKIPLIEDAAQSHGARYKKKRVGSLADAGCFSFYPTKGLGAFGDGGMIVTGSEEIHNKAKMYRDYGRKDRYEHTLVGYNTRLDTIQAVILAAKLKFLDEWNALRAKAADHYRDQLKGVKGIEVFSPKPERSHVYQTFAVRVQEDRDALCEKLQEKGVGVLIHYPIPVHLQEAYKGLGYKKGQFPAAEKLCEQVLSLPMYPHITEDKIKEVCDNIKALL